MSSGAFPSSSRITGFISWPGIMGIVTFLIITLFPPLGNVNYSMVPVWISPLVSYASVGGIAWQIAHDIGQNTFTAYPFGALLVMIGPFCMAPIALTISSVLVWRRVVSRAPQPTVRRGLLAVVLAMAFSLLIIGLLDLLVFGISFLLSSNSFVLLGMAIFALAPLSQSLAVFPFLLIAGAIIAMLQARSRTL